MNGLSSISVFVLCAALAIPLAAGQFTQGSCFAADEEHRFDTCKPLCEPSGQSGSSSSESGSSSSDSTETSSEEVASGSGSGESGEVGSGSGAGSGSGSSSEWESGEYCVLLEFLLELAESQLSGSIQTTFIEWINTTQINIVEDSSLTQYEMLVQIWFSLELVFEQYSEIASVCEYAYITDWGYVFQLQNLALDIQSEYTEVSVEDLITLGGSNDSCPLFDALLSGTANNAGEHSACEQLVEEIRAILNESLSLDVTLVLIYEQMQSFFQQYQSYEADFFAIDIEGFGCFESFYDICAVYWRIDNFDMVVGGPTMQCELVKVLTALYENTSYSTSERSDFKQLEQSVETYFNQTTDIEARIQYYNTTLYQFFLLDNWTVEAIYSLELSGYGNMNDFIYAMIYEINHGLSAADFTDIPGQSTTPGSTDEGDCSTVTEVNVFSDNTTLLITAIVDAEQNWTSAEVTQFKGYLNRIYTISSNSTVTDASKFSQIKTILTGWTSQSSSMYETVQEIVISTWGSISQYCACTVSS